MNDWAQTFTDRVLSLPVQDAVLQAVPSITRPIFSVYCPLDPAVSLQVIRFSNYVFEHLALGGVLHAAYGIITLLGSANEHTTNPEAQRHRKEAIMTCIGELRNMYDELEVFTQKPECKHKPAPVVLERWQEEYVWSTWRVWRVSFPCANRTRTRSSLTRLYDHKKVLIEVGESCRGLSARCLLMLIRAIVTCVRSSPHWSHR